jgi:hypothetical protein
VVDEERRGAVRPHVPFRGDPMIDVLVGLAKAPYSGVIPALPLAFTVMPVGEILKGLLHLLA